MNSMSMFYVKTKISDECEINTSISCDNVYTRCKKCGAEVPVDLTDWTDFIEENGIDCFGCNIYCEECSQERKKSQLDLSSVQAEKT